MTSQAHNTFIHYIESILSTHKPSQNGTNFQVLLSMLKVLRLLG